MSSSGWENEVEMGQPTCKHSFVRQHLDTARYFAMRSQELEERIKSVADRGDDGKVVTLMSNHRSYVTGAVVAAVAGLESYINELYLDARDNNLTGLLGNMTTTQLALLALWWEEIDRRPLLFKFRHALLLTSGVRFQAGEQPYQDADSLVALRNALVHYRPEWDSDLKVHAALQDRLRARFPMNPLVDETSLWFPHQCLGSGCARWAADASEGFLADFCSRMGIPNPL
jgi:hypothetical protein